MNPDVPLPCAAQLQRFCQTHDIVKLAVYGSALREDFGPDSDVDLLVKFDPEADVSLPGQIKVQEDISALFGGRRIDLFTVESLIGLIRDRIVAEAEQLYPHRKPAHQPPLAVDDDTPLRLMRGHARRAIQVSAGRTRKDLDGDRMLCDLVCFAIQRVGLRASRVSPATREDLPGIDFEELAALSRQLIEKYDTIDYDRLWAATEACPGIVQQLDAYLPPEDERPNAFRGGPVDW